MPPTRERAMGDLVVGDTVALDDEVTLAIGARDQIDAIAGSRERASLANHARVVSPIVLNEHGYVHLDRLLMRGGDTPRRYDPARRGAGLGRRPIC